MAFVTADVEPSDEDKAFPFKVIFRKGNEMVAEWLVESQEDGEAQILEAVRDLGEFDDEDGSAVEKGA